MPFDLNPRGMLRARSGDESAVAPAEGGALAALRRRWGALSLSQQFAAMALVVIGCGMTVLGAWVSRQIADGVIQNTAAATALNVDSVVEPLAQEAVRDGRLTPQAEATLDRLVEGAVLGPRVVGMKLWRADGLVLYSHPHGHGGSIYPLTEPLKAAFDGRVVGEFADLDADENEVVRGLGVPLLEIFAPLRDAAAGRVIAVVEMYEIGDRLQVELSRARTRTLVVVGALTLVMIGLLFGIVGKGSRTIVSQRQALVRQVTDLSRLLEENDALRASADDAHRRSAVGAEHFMRRVGADLHDGPAQLIGLALLQLEDFEPMVDERRRGAARELVGSVERLLSGSLDELRSLAQGLAPPELEAVAPDEALRLAAANHEWRTGVSVSTRIGALPQGVPPLLKICLYRFAQEGLTNGYKHAGGKGQALEARCKDGELVVEVSDRGPGIAPEAEKGQGAGLGLPGMRDRVESLGGRFELETRPGAGTVVRARFGIGAEGS